MSKPSVTVFIGRLDLSGGRTVMLFKTVDLLVDAGFDVTVCAFWQPRPIWWPWFKTTYPLPKGPKYTHIFKPTLKDRKAFKPVHAAENNSAERLEAFKAYCRTIEADAVILPNFGHFIETAFLENIPSKVFTILSDHHSQRYDHVFGLSDLSEMDIHQRNFYGWANDFDALHLVNPAIEQKLTGIVSNLLSIPNFIDDQPQPDSSYLGSRKIVAGGRLVPEKGFEALIRAFGAVASDHPDWTLEIYGKGPLRETLSGAIKDLSLEGKVQLLPPSREFKDKLAKAALHVSCSVTESYGLTLAEAMSFGVPVLSQNQHVGSDFLLSDGRGQYASSSDLSDLTALLDANMSLIEGGDPDEVLRSQAERAYTFAQSVSYKNTLAVWKSAILDGIASKRAQLK